MNEKTKKWLHMVSFVLVVVGAINTGLYGIIPADKNGEGFDLLLRLFGFNATLHELVCLLIGVAGIYLLVTHVKTCRVCDTK